MATLEDDIDGKGKIHLLLLIELILISVSA